MSAKKPVETPQDKVSLVSITEYCRRLSTRERRVELIGAFHSTMKAESILADTEQGYNVRFAEFENRPA